LRRRVIWDGPGGVGEGQPSGYRSDFEGAPFGAAVAAFGLVIRFRHVTPGQGGKLGVQAGLVALDDQLVVRAAPGQAGGVLTLGAQSAVGVALQIRGGLVIFDPLTVACAASAPVSKYPDGTLGYMIGACLWEGHSEG
jgi:hypothetical protein